jgi:hypothetical protein
MAGRTGFLGGLRQGGSPDWGADDGRDLGSADAGTFRFAETPRADPTGMPPGFDPVWGTLGGPTAQAGDPWLTGRTEEAPDGPVSDVEIFGTGFQITGQVRTGTFDRLSDWLNVQNGFIQVQEARHVFLGRERTPEDDRPPGTLWIRVGQIVLIGERTNAQPRGTGAVVIQKLRRKVSIVTPGYHLRGNLHVHAASSMKQFLEMPEPRFLPMTELTVRWLDNPTLAARFPFAVVNREQLITILDEPSAPGGDAAGSEDDQAHERELARQRWGAA